jgi:carbamoyltransferase
MQTLSFFARHDANMTLYSGNDLERYIEFEKFAKKRYFSFSTDKRMFQEQMEDLALPHVNPNHVSRVVSNWLTNNQYEILKNFFPRAKEWKSVHHHISHAHSVFMFTEPREGDLILSIDGGGDLDDYFKVFTYQNSQVRELFEVKVNLGKPYRLLGLLSPELYRDRTKGYRMDLPLAGKKMSLLSLGKIVDEFKDPLREFYYQFMQDYDEENDSAEINFRKLLDKIGFEKKRFLDRDTARNILATSQFVFEETIKNNVYPLLDTGHFERVIVVGGCGLNVTMNSKINSDYGIEVFVPPCPNDCGISLGAAKIDNPNLRMTSPFTNANVLNYEYLSKFRQEYPIRFLSIDELAAVLSKGAIIGTMIGDLEIGPRALGNRSYLANPFIKGMKNRINSRRIKNREIWRPVAPIVAIEDLSRYFETDNPSPYMSFAPKIRKSYLEEFSEIIHVDGSSRVQTVSAIDGWIYRLIRSFEKITGKGILMNTSFNLKGEPLVQDYKDAFQIFKQSELDAIAIHKENLQKEDKIEVFFKNGSTDYMFNETD